MVHTPRGRVSRRRRAAAITVLAEIATDPNAPAHARATAARTLVLDDPAEVDREPEDEAISTYVILPSNGRDACVRYGLYAEGQSIVIVPPGFPPEIQPEIALCARSEAARRTCEASRTRRGASTAGAGRRAMIRARDIEPARVVKAKPKPVANRPTVANAKPVANAKRKPVRYRNPDARREYMRRPMVARRMLANATQSAAERSLNRDTEAAVH